ncbi:MAG TPA: TIGR00270 family protein [Candidatus Nanopusillus sp.]|nr:TIGR00270 family protein [Candidatus Nanopusillus sp.]HIP90229.1 TIGR00270 family protein [Candidatus Nanopusillus sp.]
MICEICGKKSDKLSTIMVDGAILHVCSECRKYGREVEIKYGKVDEIRKPKVTTVPIYDEEIVDNYHIILRKYREEKGLTQEEMAKILNIKSSTYRSIEEGKIKPTIDLAKKIEKILKIKIIKKVILFEEGENKSFELTVADIIRLED